MDMDTNALFMKVNPYVGKLIIFNEIFNKIILQISIIYLHRHM